MLNSIESIQAFTDAHPDARFIFEDGHGVYSPASGSRARIHGNSFRAFTRRNKLVTRSTANNRKFQTVGTA